jgi:hypothetical protein
MLHKTEILSIFENKVASSVRERHWPPEVREIDREASVYRMLPAMDDAGTREREMDQPDP